jgi:hypothetical protein
MIPRLILILPALLFTILSGCNSADQVMRYTAESEQQQILTSELIRDRYQSVPFSWDVPGEWKSAQNDEFSKFAWLAGQSGRTRITVSDLPATAGIAPQVARWGGQIGLQPESPAELMNSVEPLPLAGLTGQWVELKGPTETILGMLLTYKEKLWVVKLRGSNEEVGSVRDQFRSFCQSWNAG